MAETDSNIDYSQVNTDELGRLSAQRKNANGADVDGAEELRAKQARGEALSPTERYFLQYQSGNGANPYRPTYNPVTGSTSWSFSANDARAAGVDKNGKPFASNADYFDQLVALGQLTPEQANFYRNAQGRSPGGSGSGSGGGYAPGSFSGSGAGGAGTPPPGSSSGGLPGQVAGAVGYNGYAQYGAGQAEGQQSELEKAILAGLTGKGGYSQDLLDKMRSTGKAELMAQYEEAKRSLEGEMAKRGIAASSIALERSSGLMGQNQRALGQFETDLAKQTEDALRSDRQSAITAALALRGQQSQEGQFAQTFGLSVAQFNQQASQWAQQFGLDQAKFAEATRQFNTSLAEQQRQFGLTYDLQSQQFKAQAAQWAAQFGLDQNKFYEAVRQFNASQTQQQNQFDKTYDQQTRQIITQIIQGLQGKVDANTLAAILRSFGIDPAKYGINTGGGNGGGGAPARQGSYDGETITYNGQNWVWDGASESWRNA